MIVQHYHPRLYDKKHAYFRRGLSESLEEFAARQNRPVDQVRDSWRLQGLRYLHPRTIGELPWEDVVKHYIHLGSGSPRICPGLAVPTKEVTIYEEDEQCFAD